MHLPGNHCRSLPGLLAGAGFFAEFHAEAWNRMEGVDFLPL